MGVSRSALMACRAPDWPRFYAPTFDGYSAGSPERKMEEWLAATVGKFDEFSRRYSCVSVCGLPQQSLTNVFGRPNALGQGDGGQ
jgi:hypothetical protein